MAFATVYCLLYGDYYSLHVRLLGSLVKYLPAGEARVVVWANVVGKQTVEWFRKQAPKDWEVVLSSENVLKYIAMRRMLHETHKPTTSFILWLDDDSWVCKSDWWAKTTKFIESKQAENICYVGQPFYVHWLSGQWGFVQQSSWYQGKPPEMCPTKTKNVKRPGITFATGGYVWLRTDVMRYLNWPDERLRHNGGDTLLGEAVRQQGLPFHKYHYGVRVNDARRRGFHEKPAGSVADVRR